jgi:xanthine dehydrogenase accessory factor
MEASLGPLLPLFERERRAGRPLALGVLVHTQGSTYGKPGALIAIAANGDYAGLISGGCLEGDLREHALTVIAEGRPRSVHYDLRGPDDLLWGLGAGCEGAMRIMLLPVGRASDWQPLECLALALEAQRPMAIGVVCDSADPQVPLGSVALPLSAAVEMPAPLQVAAVQACLAEVALSGASRWLQAEHAAFGLFVLPLALPPRILILGAGPDVVPLVEFAVRLNWRVTVLDHRAAYANAAHFAAAAEVRHARPDELSAPELGRFHAAVVMSHHLPTDAAYLRSLSGSDIPYIGLLGPPQRRDKLLADLGPEAQRLQERLHAPVGLPLGGRSPESVALTIVAELQAFFQGRLAPARAALAAAPRAHSGVSA